MSLTLIAVFGVFQVILFLEHADVYQALAATFGWHAPWIAWFFAILSLTFVSSSALTFQFCNSFVKWYYRVSAYWFGLLQFLFGGATIFFIVENLVYRTGHYVSPLTLGIICLGIPFLAHSYATWRTAHPRFTRISVAPSPNHPAWPAFWQGKKIVFVSDLHLGAVLGSGFSKKIVEMIKSEKPEAVLIGGDIFDGVKCHSQSLIEPFLELRPPEGIYFTSGNHEYIEDTKLLFEEIPRAGIRILHNQVVDVKGIQFAGVDWKDTYHKNEFEKILGNMKIDRSKPSMLMRHEPNHLEVAESAGVTMTLCGHTHAGQIWPLGYITGRFYKGFDYGFKNFNEMLVYTSSGVGTWGPPLRFGTKAEIVVMTLE